MARVNSELFNLKFNLQTISLRALCTKINAINYILLCPGQNKGPNQLPKPKELGERPAIALSSSNRPALNINYALAFGAKFALFKHFAIFGQRTIKRPMVLAG